MVSKTGALSLAGVLVVLAAVGALGAGVVNVEGEANPPVREFVLEPVSVNATASTVEFRHVAGDPMPYGNMEVTVETNTGQRVVFEPPTRPDEEQVASRDTVIVVSTAPPRILVAETRGEDRANARMHEVYSSTRSGNGLDLSRDDVDAATFVFTNTRTGDVVFETSIPLV